MPFILGALQERLSNAAYGLWFHAALFGRGRIVAPGGVHFPFHAKQKAMVRSGCPVNSEKKYEQKSNPMRAFLFLVIVCICFAGIDGSISALRRDDRLPSFYFDRFTACKR